MQYPFTEEQVAVANLTRNFMEREVAPVAAEFDARPDPKDCYPRELINKASKLGLRTLAIPEEYGGMDANLMTKTIALWTGGQIEIGTIKCLSQCWKATTALSKAGTKEQKTGGSKNSPRTTMPSARLLRPSPTTGRKTACTGATPSSGCGRAP